MKHISKLFSGLLLAVMAASPMAAQTNYDVWVTTEGSGIALHGGQPTRQVVVHHDGYCHHHPHFRKGCKACEKAYKKHKKAVRKARKQAEHHHHKAVKARKHHHHR
ncbi:MAG: DUF1611 domain-containing protein [Bacteroides sp.]|nr:DUF1611 domain-containing protein [Bacteroides sp.]MBD5336377.1 DUF1611 domain-containing protein [Bacteroides sp.]